MSTLTLIILLVNVFLMGVIAVVAGYYWRAHRHQGNTVIEPKKDMPEPEFPKLEIPPEIIKRISQEAEAHYQKILTNSATYLQQGLVETATDMNNLVKQWVTQVINEELANYRKEMDQMRQKAAAEVGGVKAEMEAHKDELRAGLAKEVEAEKQQLLKQVDTRLGDAVASFLIETLGHNVDLGNQNEYLTSLLEEHKAEFVKEIGGLPADQKPEVAAQPSAEQPASTAPTPATVKTSDPPASVQSAAPDQVAPAAVQNQPAQEAAHEAKATE